MSQTDKGIVFRIICVDKKVVLTDISKRISDEYNLYTIIGVA